MSVPEMVKWTRLAHTKAHPTGYIEDCAECLALWMKLMNDSA